MLYIQPQLKKDPTNGTVALLRVLVHNTNPSAVTGNVSQVAQSAKAPTVLYASEYLLYTALVVALGGAGFALIVRLISVLDYRFLLGRKIISLSSVVISLTVLTLLFGFLLLFIAATLQLPSVVNSHSQ